MGRRSKSTAKTGDGALYKQQASASQKKKKEGYNITTDDDANDGMYDKVDRYHNHLEQDEIQFDEPEHAKEEEEKEAVFDLGLGASSDEEDDDDDDDDSGEDPIASDASGSASEEDNAASSEEEDTDDEQITTLKSELQNTNSNSDILNWGSKKRDYYMADTANRQQDGKSGGGGKDGGGKGDDSDSDAEMEEEAGREIQKARYATMDEDDFLPDGVVAALPKTKASPAVTAAVPSPNPKHSVNRSREETMEQLERDNPEFLPLVQHFSKVGVQELTERLLIVSKQLSDWKQAQTVGTSTNGLRYLYQKKMVCLSTTLNLIMYLLLKMEADEQYRKQLHDTNTQFNDDDDAATNHTIAYDSLSFNVRSHPVITRLNELNDVASKLKQEVEERCGLSEQLNSLVQASALMEGGDLSEDETDEDDDDDSKNVTDSGEFASEEDVPNTHSRRDAAVIETTEVDEYVPPHNIRHEARFAVRADDIDHTNGKQAPRVPTSDDFGDEDGPADRTAATNLSATMNRISQKGKERTKARVKKSEDEKEGPTLQFQRGLDMMDEMLGPPSDEDGDEEDADEDQPDDDFYTAAKRRSEKKKAERHEAYAVAPKFPRFEGTVEGERAVGYQIMKNRGLVPHQKKANKNPRVRKREQYRKAVIRRKGAVRDIRTGEAVTYGGEDTGIKTGISRSRKLGKLS